MKTSDFNYELPDSFIAQTPVEPRDSSRLMVLNRETGQVQHRIFREIGEYLNPGDLLVVNQTRVIPARLKARKESGGKAEILLLRRESDTVWECLVGGKGLSLGKKLRLEDGLEAQIVSSLEGSRRRVQFEEPVESHLPLDGQMPLPPYIHEKLSDPERYQTVYAKTPGSAAAPTAGLHFTPRLMDELRAQGIQFAEVTLHVGLDTFAPVTEADPRQHKIHTEWCELTPETAAKINATKAAGGRIIGVGTTSVRTLESAAPVARDAIPRFEGQDNTPRFEGRDNTPSFEGRDNTPRFEGRDNTPRFEGRDSIPHHDKGQGNIPRSEGRDSIPHHDKGQDNTSRSEGRDSIPHHDTWQGNIPRSEGRDSIPHHDTWQDSIPHHDTWRGSIPPYAGATSIFILPGYSYRVVDAIITNFHLPKSTLIMMISAFAGRETVLNAYETAKREGYRFFSFGDAMLIV